jgi:hypothetical protein
MSRLLITGSDLGRHGLDDSRGRRRHAQHVPSLDRDDKLAGNPGTGFGMNQSTP